MKMNNPEKIITREELFVESDNEIQTFNDLLRLFDYWTSIPVTREHTINVARALFPLSIPALLNAVIIISDSHKKSTPIHIRALINENRNLFNRFMDTVRGDAGTPEEIEMCNYWIEGKTNIFVDFLKNRKDNQYMEIA